MSLQSMVMSNHTLARYFMSHAPEGVHERAGRSLAARALRTAVERTQAYPAFLLANGIQPGEALRPERFSELPLTSKRGYIERYSLTELVRDGKLTTAYTIEKSSGYSGRTHYWLRTPEEDAMFPTYMEFAFKEFYKMSDESTLVIIAFALGTWTSGEKMAQALRKIAAKGDLPMSVVSPGIDIDEILEIAHDLCPLYGQTVLFGYPPFVKAAIDAGIEQGIDWGALNLRLGLGGEGFSEEWRRHVVEKIGCDPKRDLLAITGGYGAADLGMTIGREYPLSILVRQLASDDADLARDLFGDVQVPNLFQYSPSACLIEEVDGELVFTVDSGIPLVRYRIGDRGGVLAFEHVMEVLASHAYDPYARLAALGYDRQAVWQMPFFHCSGRADGAILIGGLNVYPENIAAALDVLDDPQVKGFKVATTTAEDGVTDRLLIMLERREDKLSDARAQWLARTYVEPIIDGLRRVNKEYRRLHEASPRLAKPVVKVYAAAHGPFAADVGKIKRKYVQ